VSDASVTFVGNADQLLAEHKKIEAANAKEIEQLKQKLADSKKFYNEEKKLIGEANTALDKLRTAQEIYNAQVQKWFNLLAQGKITSEQFNKLKGEEKAKLDAATAAIEKARLAQEKLTAASKAGNVETQRSGQLADVTANGFAFMATKALLAVAAIKKLAEEQKRQREAAEVTVKTVDDLSRDYAIQGGLKTDEQRLKARAEIMTVARENGSTVDQAFNTASQLASSGFEAPTGDTLDSALKIIKTSDMAKGDPKGYIDAAARYLKASNRELNGKNLLEIGVAMRGLADTPVQASDLSEFAAAAPVLNMQGVDWKTGLGMMTELRRGMSGAESGTKMRNIALKLAKASTDKQASEALETLGLKPEDVDAIGETMPQALQVLGERINAQPIEKRVGLMTKIFEGENVAAADILMKNLPGVEKNVKAMSDDSLFTAGVNFQLQGYNAETNRATIELQSKQLEDEASVTRKSILLKEVEVNRIERMRTQGVMKNTYDTIIQNPKDDLMNQLGAVSDDELLQRSKTGIQLFNGYESEQQQADARKRLDKSGTEFTQHDLQRRLNGAPGNAAPDPAMAEQNAILKDIRGAVTNPANRPVVNPTVGGRTDR
jgi:hypothetical protein